MASVLRLLQLGVLTALLACGLGIVHVSGSSIRVDTKDQPSYVRAALAQPGRVVATIHELQAVPANYFAARLDAALRK